MASADPVFGDLGSDGLEVLGFFGGELVGFEFTDAEGAHEEAAHVDGDGDIAADVGFLGFWAGDAGGIRLEVAHADGFHAFSGGSGDSFAHGDALDFIHQFAGDAAVADKFQHGMEVVPFVEGACLAVEFLEDEIKDGLPVWIAAHGGGDGFDSGRAHRRSR